MRTKIITINFGFPVDGCKVHYFFGTTKFDVADLAFKFVRDHAGRKSALYLDIVTEYQNSDFAQSLVYNVPDTYGFFSNNLDKEKLLAMLHHSLRDSISPFHLSHKLISNHW